MGRVASPSRSADRKAARERDQNFFTFAKFLCDIAIDELKKKNPNPTQEQLNTTLEATLKPQVVFRPCGKNLSQIVTSMDASHWHKNPVGSSIEVAMKGYVRRHEIWETLEATGLSINHAAKILCKGESFRKWANAKAAPNEITQVTKNELQILKWAAVFIHQMQEMAQNETPEEKAHLMALAQSMEAARGFALIFKEWEDHMIQKDREAHPERYSTFLTERAVH